MQNRAEPRPQGCVVCKGTYVTPTKKVNKPFAFEISDTRNNKVFFIHASSKSEMDSWVQALEKASQYQAVGEASWGHIVHVDFKARQCVLVVCLTLLFRLRRALLGCLPSGRRCCRTRKSRPRTLATTRQRR